MLKIETKNTQTDLQSVSFKAIIRYQYYIKNFDIINPSEMYGEVLTHRSAI